jgi:hypothetical protein
LEAEVTSMSAKTIDMGRSPAPEPADARDADVRTVIDLREHDELRPPLGMEDYWVDWQQPERPSSR